MTGKNAEIPAVGVDIVQISRLAQALRRRPRLCQRLFTSSECHYCNAHANPPQHYAARFAAKEAVAKALGKSLSWQEVEITAVKAGPPQAVLHGGAQKIAAGGKMQISLSHSGDYAIACALYNP